MWLFIEKLWNKDTFLLCEWVPYSRQKTVWLNKHWLKKNWKIFLKYFYHYHHIIHVNLIQEKMTVSTSFISHISLTIKPKRTINETNYYRKISYHSFNALTISWCLINLKFHRWPYNDQHKNGFEISAEFAWNKNCSSIFFSFILLEYAEFACN